MAPKSEKYHKNNYEPTSNGTENVDESDIVEIESVNESLDELSSALDFIEQRTDNILEQLKELLHSNREIRQSIARERESADKIEKPDVELN